MWKNRGQRMRKSITACRNSNEENALVEPPDNTWIQNLAMSGNICSSYMCNSRWAEKNMTLEKAMHEAMAAKGTVSLEKYLDIPTYLRRGLTIST